jgi:hypothetical protein
LYWKYDVVHLTVDILQDLIIGKKLLVKFCIDPQLILDNLSERGHILVEILHITTLLAVVKGEVGLIPSRIAALI